MRFSSHHLFGDSNTTLVSASRVLPLNYAFIGFVPTDGNDVLGSARRIRGLQLNLSATALVTGTKLLPLHLQLAEGCG